MNKCKLVIHDEVNCSFVGLNSEDRNYLHNKSKIFNPSLRFTPQVRLGRWDGKTPYFNMGGKTYINLLGSMLEYLNNKNYEIDLEDERTYNRDFSFSPVDNNFFSGQVWPEKHEMAGKPIILRDHQTEVVNIFLEKLQGVISCPTGSGKSLITAILSKKIEKYGRSLIIVPNKDLITQTEKYYIDLGLDVGVYYGDRKEFFKTHTIATWQSLEILRENSIDIGLPEPITFEQFINNTVAVIVDECLAPGTKILTPSGEKNIEDMKVGDEIFSFNENKKCFIIDEVIKVHHNLMNSNSEKMFEISMEDGTILKITGNHKILTQRGWIEVKHLTINDDILEYKS